jgi:hypothetical protein
MLGSTEPEGSCLGSFLKCLERVDTLNFIKAFLIWRVLTWKLLPTYTAVNEGKNNSFSVHFGKKGFLLLAFALTHLFLELLEQ